MNYEFWTRDTPACHNAHMLDGQALRRAGTRHACLPRPQSINSAGLGPVGRDM